MQSRALLLACVAFLSLLAGLTGVRLAYSLAYVVLSLLALSFIWSRATSRRLTVTRESPSGTFTVGEPFTERFTACNHSSLPVAYCEVVDHSPIDGYLASRVCTLARRASVSWSARGVFDRRGRHSFGPLEARIGDPFGLFPKSIQVRAAGEMLVHPAVHPVDDLAPAWSGGSAGDGQPGRPLDVAPDVSTVREYQTDDGQSRIHWKSTARTGRLMSCTYDTPQTSGLLVVLDLGSAVHAGEAPESTLEYAVSLAASICHASLRRGHAVGLVTNDAAGTIFRTRRGEAWRLRLLDFLAVAAADGTVPVAEAVSCHGRSWRGRGGLCVITPDRNPEWVEALLDTGMRGTRPLCVVVEPTSFGAPGTPLRVSAAWRQALNWRLIRRGDMPTSDTSAHVKTR